MKVTFPYRLAVAALFFLSSTAALAEEPRAKAVAPENHLQLKDTASGTYYVAKPLKEEYDRLLSRLRVLQGDIESERTSGAEAILSLRTLQTDLVRLRDEIEKNKKFVPVANTHVQTDTTTFDLGAERLLVITADNVRLVGWEGPGVKVELEKTILSVDGKLDEAEMTGLKIVHKHAPAPEKVGRTKEENETAEAAFLNTKDGQALSLKNREWRKKFHDEIQAHYAIYRDFQGKAVDTLEIEGLTHDQGNRQMTLEVNSKDGDGSHRSVWRRHARLTVYLPACKSVAIRGGKENLDIQNIKTSLVITADDSRDRDYHSESRIRGVTGSLAAEETFRSTRSKMSAAMFHTLAPWTWRTQEPRTTVAAIRGKSSARSTSFAALPCSVKNIGGNFHAWLCRVDLDVQDVAGRIDVRNEFGDTRLRITKPLAKEPHRIVSEAGRIELNFSPATLGELPLWATTQCGNVRTNASRELLDSYNFTQGMDSEGVSRNWSGFRRTKKEDAKFDPSDFLESASRADKALHNQTRSPGLDLISRGGTVVVTAK